MTIFRNDKITIHPFRVLRALATAVAVVSPWVALTASSEQQQLKIYISADLEGITGVVSEQQSSPTGTEYQSARRQMTADVNAAVEGAYAAGATEVLVSDSHGNGQNIVIEELDERVRLVRGFPRELDMMHGIDDSFDAAIFIGYHASANTQDAILAHTGNSRIAKYELNGLNVPEGGLNAAIAGYFGVPVVMISGDGATISELRQLLGNIEGAQVKTGHGQHSGTILSPERSIKTIRESAERAVTNLARYKPLVIRTPVTVDVSFFRTVDAEVAALFPLGERVGPNRVRFVVPDIIGAAKLFNGLMYLSPPGQ